MFARIRLCLGAAFAAAVLGATAAGAATVDLGFDRFDRASLACTAIQRRTRSGRAGVAFQRASRVV